MNNDKLAEVFITAMFSSFVEQMTKHELSEETINSICLGVDANMKKLFNPEDPCKPESPTLC